jgi:hypothetical protein
MQSLLTVSGGDGHEMDGNADGSIEHDQGPDTQYFTIKNLIAFFTLFGWTGLAAYHAGLGKPMAIILAAASGLAIVFIMVLLVKNISRLKHSGTMKIENAINKTGNTYLFIPGKRGGMGKVHIKVQGALRELPAMTDDEETIATGKLIRVKTILNDQILLVTLAENALY